MTPCYSEKKGKDRSALVEEEVSISGGGAIKDGWNVAAVGLDEIGASSGAESLLG